MQNPKSEHNILQTIAVLVAIVLLFGLVGNSDYADALERENAELRGAISVCHARAVQP